jgi:serine/threonine-protein kinase
MSDDELHADPVTRRAEARVGQVLRGKWRLDRLIGIGGMAAVYESTHRNGKRGAVKLLHLELSIDEEARRRFLQEGYAANRVEHPGAVSVLDDDAAEDGSVFIVMELLDGRSVSDVAEAQPGGRLDLATTLAVADQVLDVLAAAHDKGIVHRDLKPENLFLTRAGALKVLDFGLARIDEHRSGVNATRTGNAMGTPAYMAPEQALGNWSEVDARTDLWAIGATLFSLLSGRLVHQAATVQQLMLAAMTKPAPSLRSVAPEVPPSIAAVVDRALAFDRGARWPDARAMQRALRDAARGVGLAPAAIVVPALGPAAQSAAPSLLGATLAVTPRGPRRRAAIGAAIAGLGLVIAAGIATLGMSPRAAPTSAGTPPSAEAPPGGSAAATTSAPPPTVAPAPPPEPVASAPASASASARAPAPRASAKAPPGPAKKPGAAPAGTPDPFGAFQ